MVGEKFFWTAIYKDRTELKQFNDDGSENLFKDIEQDRLMAFRVDGGDKHIIVDLFNGLFVVNGVRFETEFSERHDNYRLIYFRRVRKNIGTVNVSEGTVIKHFVGYQLDVDGENKQSILGLNENGAGIIDKQK